MGAVLSFNGGRVMYVSSNLELAKFLLFYIPKMPKGSLKGDFPQLEMDEDVQRLLRVSQRIRAVKLARIQEAMRNGEYDDDIPF